MAAAREEDPFRRVLRELVLGIPEAWGAIFVDWEGEAVELFARTEEYEVKLAGAEIGLLLSRMVAAGKESGLGHTTAALVRTETADYLLHTLDEEYFVLLAAHPLRTPGVARARLATAVAALRAAL